MVGFLAYVIDAGMFFMIRRELQNTADTAALAGAAWLRPLSTNGEPASTLQMPSPLPSQCNNTFGQPTPDTIRAAQAACAYGEQNAATARKLCLTPDVQMDPPIVGQWAGHSAVSPTMVVNFHCVAGYSFGRIIPGLTSRPISAHAEAALGLRTCGPPQNPGMCGQDVSDFITDFSWWDPNQLLIPGNRRATRLLNS